MDLTNLGLGLASFREGARQTGLDIGNAMQDMQAREIRNYQIGQMKREEALKIEEDRQTKAFDESVKNKMEEQKTPNFKTTLKPSLEQGAGVLSEKWGINQDTSLYDKIANKYVTTEIPKPQKTQFEIMAEESRNYPIVFKKYGMDYYNIAKGEAELKRKENIDALNFALNLKKRYKNPQAVKDIFVKVYPDKSDWLNKLDQLKDEKGMITILKDKVGNVPYNVIGIKGEDGDIKDINVVRGDNPVAETASTKNADETASMKNYDFYINNEVARKLESQGRAAIEINAILKSKPHRNNFITLWNRSNPKDPIVIKSYNDWRLENNNSMNEIAKILGLNSRTSTNENPTKIFTYDKETDTIE